MTDGHRPYPALPRLTDEERIAKARSLSETLATRRSCRHFSSDSVPKEVIELAIQAAGTAPSGANHQPWHFAAISSPGIKRRIREAAEQEERRFYGFDGAEAKAGKAWLDALDPLGTDDQKPFLETAPWLIVVFAQRKGGIAEDGETQNYYVTESVGIACGLLLATLHKAGLATLTHTPSPMGFLREICRRPETEKPVMIVVAGHPAPEASVPDHAAKKKPLETISSWL
ncbi:nitroreductase family protein [Altererythrobacter aurantiacus]|uniref:Nitroreductase family protein n=1 Tax=Parapontixanthobacter aurantiacus TaxID=1463599 RepID=A0A844Z9C4_9SPHN|nr:nitroreductase family protein [Parapontixanthobacter aurantiacus]MXO85191.1 nitroreductase family protein [Parapontixanthobacter aurantiacus]